VNASMNNIKLLLKITSFGASVVYIGYKLSRTKLAGDFYESIVLAQSKFITSIRSKLLTRWSTVFRSTVGHELIRQIALAARTEVTGDHTHPESAALRRQFYRGLQQFYATHMGLTIGVKQPSVRDHGDYFGANIVKYDHNVHWALDLLEPAKQYNVSELDHEIIVDTDYYINMEVDLSTPRVIVMYTFTPSATARTHEEYSYYFTRDNKINYTIHGTADNFIHPIWNWKSGSYHYACSWFSGVLYRVHALTLSQDRSAIVLEPWVKIGLLGSLVAKIIGFESTLKRYSTYNSNSNIAYHRLTYGNEVHISPADLYGRSTNDYVFTKETLGRAIALRTSQPTCTASAFVKLDNRYDAAALLSKLSEIWTNKQSTDMFSDTIIGDTSAVRYSLLIPSHDKDMCAGKTLPVATPIAGYVPPAGLTGAISAYTGRIVPGREKALRSKAEQYIQFAVEFAELLIKSNGTEPILLAPEEAVQQLNQPKHKQARARDPPTFDTDICKGKLFPKIEAYSKPTESRPIIDCSHQFKHTYTMVTGSLAKILKTTEWYAFGVGPEELVSRIVKLATGEAELVETDYSRFDTTIGGIRILEECLLKRLFDDIAVKLWSQQMEAKVKVGNFRETWFKYTAQMERLSGSPETSVLNSVDNALVSYCGLREEMEPNEAWKELGLYGGDDGIQKSRCVAQIESVAKNCGLDLKLTVRKNGTPFSFLGRYYNAWAGEAWSCYDPVRCLSKIQYTADASVTQELALGRKLASLNYTDKTTPWVVDLTHKYIDRFGPLPTGQEFDIEVNYYAWLMQQTGEVFPQPPVEKTPVAWMLDLYDTLITGEIKVALDKIFIPCVLNSVLTQVPTDTPEEALDRGLKPTGLNAAGTTKPSSATSTSTTSLNSTCLGAGRRKYWRKRPRCAKSSN